jgi:hypothetical protein
MKWNEKDPEVKNLPPTLSDQHKIVAGEMVHGHAVFLSYSML